MPTINIPVWINVLQNIRKTYHVNRIRNKMYNSIYDGNTEWIAHWFYTQIDPNIDNVTFEILGGFHQTYPHPEHLSIRIIYPDGQITPIMHVQYNKESGQGSTQILSSQGYVNARGFKKRKTKKYKKYRKYRKYRNHTKYKNKK